MATEKVELTKEGEARLQEQLRHLIDIDRPECIEQLKAARAQGDLSENADYDAARNRQAEIEGKIKEIENILANAKIITEKSGSKVVALGSTVEVKDLSDGTVGIYTIVGTVESNPRVGKISNVSPLGQAIIGKRVGDKALVKVAKEYEVEVLKIDIAK